MARRVVTFTLLFYLCSMAPLGVGAALAWALVLVGIVSAVRARDAASTVDRVADPQPVPVMVPRFSHDAMGLEGAAAAPSLCTVGDWVDRCLRPGGHRGGTPAIERYLVIVSRDRPELWRDLRLAYDQADKVEILLDRRDTPHRLWPPTDRDRRSPRRRRTDVAGQGFWVIPHA